MDDGPDRFNEFWKALEEVIDEAAGGGLVPEQIQKNLSEVWDNDTRLALHRVRDGMDENTRLLRPGLESVALTGRALDIKLGEFLAARDRWGARRDRWSFRSVVGWAKIILGSLLQGLKEIPGLQSLVEGIKEFMEMFDQAVADAETL